LQRYTVGVKVTKGVKASDQLTKVVADELCELMVGLCTLNQVDP
jgi:signal recognition particle GTPase